jgi:hypothetical protein
MDSVALLEMGEENGWFRRKAEQHEWRKCGGGGFLSVGPIIAERGRSHGVASDLDRSKDRLDLTTALVVAKVGSPHGCGRASPDQLLEHCTGGAKYS